MVGGPMTPLICTQNTYSHIDYGIPLVANKSNDYRTSTSQHHQLIPNVPQNFDCRRHVFLKPAQLMKDIALREEWKSAYVADFEPKAVETMFVDEYGRSSRNTSVRYMRSVQENLYKNPVKPVKFKLSEMKDSYRIRYRYPQEQDVTLTPPAQFSCELQIHERGVQQSIRPEDKGCSKLTDIYCTDNKSKYLPYTSEQLRRAQEDFITCYNAVGKHKGLQQELPGRTHGNKTVFDKRSFKWVAPCRFLGRNSGLIIKPMCQHNETEYKGKYLRPELSDYFPYLTDPAVEFSGNYSTNDPWQMKCAPGMYSTEASHIGTSRSVRTVVDIGSEGEEAPFPPHQTCCVKVNTK